MISHPLTYCHRPIFKSISMKSLSLSLCGIHAEDSLEHILWCRRDPERPVDVADTVGIDAVPGTSSKDRLLVSTYGEVDVIPTKHSRGVKSTPNPYRA